MVKIVEDINDILAEWDPIGVGQFLAREEYKQYVPAILNVINSKEELRKCLEGILVNEMGLGFDTNNDLHFSDLDDICEKLIRIG